MKVEKTKTIFINKKKWKTFDSIQTKKYVNNIISHCREKGFPFFPKDNVYRKKEFNKLMKYDSKNLIDWG